MFLLLKHPEVAPAFTEPSFAHTDAPANHIFRAKALFYMSVFVGPHKPSFHAISVMWAPSHTSTNSCVFGYAMCVSLKHGLVIMSEYHFSGGSQLHLYSLVDGSLVRVIGTKGHGNGRGQFNFGSGGLCVSPDGDSVLVAEYSNKRVQEVNIMDGSWVRFVGEGVLERPQYVDCNNKVIVVSEGCHRMSVLAWHKGDLISQFGSRGSGPGQLDFPRGVRLLVGCPTGASSLIVADLGNHRLCVFGLNGEFVRAMGSKEQGLSYPYDVLESIDGFIVANYEANNLVKVSSGGEVVGVYGKHGSWDGEFDCPSALAALPDGGLVVREFWCRRFQVFRGLGLRVEWITACVSLARK